MTFSLSHLVIKSNGSYSYIPGALFQLPPELSSEYCLTQYSKAKNLGWVQSELGYWLYAFQDDELLIVVPGLYLTDAAPPRKKVYGYKANYSKHEIESYIKNHLDWRRNVREASEKELTSLIHDLRHLSTSIYHSATEAETACKSRDTVAISEKIKSIIASQVMLKVRIDYLDYANSVDRFSEIEDIPVYSRVDKVKRCFTSDARHKMIDIYLTGASFRLARGPNILDIVSYTLVENAIKYSPRGGNIEIAVEDTDRTTKVSVTSTGPRVADDEIISIFERGKRGATAISARPSGTGLGLAVAKEIIDVFMGTMAVGRTGDVRIVDDIPMQKIVFSFEIPTSGVDVRRKSTVEKWRGKRRRYSEANKSGTDF